jgi:FtsP/CotA-like multicopper oxidase with cupredoxin domain
MLGRVIFCLLVASAAAAQPARVFDVAVAEGRPAVTIRVTRGDDVELRWSSERSVTLHLHGYDIEGTVAPGAPAVMAFKAHIAGRFPVSEHAHAGRHGRTVLYLEVHP